MTCLNVVLVISTLTLASHGLFVNNAATENQVTPPLKQYPAGTTPVSPEDLQLGIDIIFGKTPKTTELPPRHITLVCDALFTSDINSPIESVAIAEDNERKHYIKVIKDDDEPTKNTVIDYEFVANVSSEEDFMPCKYGSSKNPFPVPNINITGRRVSDIKCEEHMWHLKYRILDAEYNKKQCNKLRRISQVIGGIKSPEGEFPHMGAVGWIANNNKIIFKCGATLISSRFSLSSGRCKSLFLLSTNDRYPDGIRHNTPKIVRFGSVYIKQANNKYAIDMIIDTFIVPSEFSAYALYNSVGLIRFTEEVQFSEFVRPACLWSGSIDRLSTGIITGWGVTKDVVTSPLSQLQHAEVDILNKDVCQRSMRSRPIRFWTYDLDNYQLFCAGKLNGGVDIRVCLEDSGSPIQIRQPLPMDIGASIYYVLGINNIGISCGKPGVYTNVSQFLNWIETTVWNDKKNN